MIESSTDNRTPVLKSLETVLEKIHDISRPESCPAVRLGFVILMALVVVWSSWRMAVVLSAGRRSEERQKSQKGEDVQRARSRTQWSRLVGVR